MMEIKGENRFRVLAYAKAATMIQNLPYELRDIALTDIEKLKEIPGIGQALSEKIVELVLTGKCEFHQKLVKEFPAGLIQMLRLRTVGPKKAKLFYEKLGIKSIPELKKAAQEGKLRDLPKMGEKSEAEILLAIEQFDKTPHERRYLHEVLQEALHYLAHMKSCEDIDQIQYAGSLRRQLDTVGDIDILVSGKNPERISDCFIKYKEVKKVLNHGPTRSSVLLKSGIGVDLRVVPSEIFGAALHYFTGSKAHNIRIRDRAKKMGLKVNEYGVFKINGEKEKLIGGKSEEEVFKAVGFSYIPPEIREDRGEIEWAESGKSFPHLIELEDLKGDLHCHSQWSDGKQLLEEVVLEYQKAGFEYMAMTDHSKNVGVVRGLTDERAQEYFQEIDRMQKKIGGTGGKKFKILKGSEVDILKNGSLDYSEKVLKQFDLLVASVHSHFRLPEEEQTKRVITAIKSGFIQILGHPTGRMIHQREPISLNMEAIIKACIDHHVALEINGSPPRMDLNDIHVKMGKDLGAKFVISTDSHHSSQMEFLRYGIGIARRGWLTKEDVLNTRPAEEVMKYWERT